MEATTEAPAGKRERSGILILIGIAKLLKGVLLIAAATAAMRLVHADLTEKALQWARDIHVAPGNRLLQRLLDRLGNVSPRQLKIAGVVLYGYAALFTTEGVGLLMRKYWAEWLTVISTALLIPFEVYELYHRPSAAKAVMLVANVAIVVYLVWRVRREHAERKAEHQR